MELIANEVRFFILNSNEVRFFLRYLRSNVHPGVKKPSSPPAIFFLVFLELVVQDKHTQAWTTWHTCIHIIIQILFVSQTYAYCIASCISR